MPVQYQFPQVDFSQLGQIGGALGAGYRRQKIGNALEGINGDWNMAAQRLLEMGYPDEAAQIGALGIAQQRNAIGAMGMAQRAKKSSQPSVGMLREKYKAEDDRDSFSATISNLEEAQKILQSPEGIYAGGLAGAQTELGTNWNYGGVFDRGGALGGVRIDPVKAKNTAAFLRIMSPEAMLMMAQQLKGSTAYQELLEFKKLYSDPNVPNELKAAQLTRLLDASKRHLATKVGRIKEIEGSSDSGGADDGEPEIGLERDSPQGRVRYIGNDTWELIE